MSRGERLARKIIDKTRAVLPDGIGAIVQFTTGELETVLAALRSTPAEPVEDVVQYWAEYIDKKTGDRGYRRIASPPPQQEPKPVVAWRAFFDGPEGGTYIRTTHEELVVASWRKREDCVVVQPLIRAPEVQSDGE